MGKIKQPQTANNTQNNRFWNFIPAAGTKPPELILYGTIASAQSWWDDRVTPAQFNQELAALGDVSDIIVRINSGGGDVFAANAIYTRLKDHEANIIVKIDGWAASAATIIAMAGDTIKIARNGVFMIHDPAMTVWDTFTAQDFEKMAGELKVIKQSIVNSYAMKTKEEPETIEALMEKETWWTGEDAVINGFCDELMFEESQTMVENSSKIIVNSVPIDISMYKTMPKMLLNNQNKAKKEEKKEEHHMENTDTNKITTVEALETQYPDLVGSIRNQAVEQERTRIKNIQAMALEGFEDIIQAAMFEKPISAEQVAMNIINRQKEVGGQYLADRDQDVNNANMGGIEGRGPQSGTANEFEAAIEELL